MLVFSKVVMARLNQNEAALCRLASQNNENGGFAPES